MSNNGEELEKYPKFKALYLKAFAELIKVRRQEGLPVPDMWATPEAMMRWWTKQDQEQVDTEITKLLEERET